MSILRAKLEQRYVIQAAAWLVPGSAGTADKLFVASTSSTIDPHRANDQICAPHLTRSEGPPVAPDGGSARRYLAEFPRRWPPGYGDVQAVDLYLCIYARR